MATTSPKGCCSKAFGGHGAQLALRRTLELVVCGSLWASPAHHLPIASEGSSKAWPRFLGQVAKEGKGVAGGCNHGKRDEASPDMLKTAQVSS